ncbi:hypothetical protein Pmani_015030 [Petrolisthes manimaculis]|uniref:Uncharacterized protein n=1 Tax=Petrolisthes manimaculis TaxID=1843537 RepID=A0AAE1UAC2_9EUCA|nr:hypothetical protein Pmani_015030 [Petrolisthes manimaculis]
MQQWWQLPILAVLLTQAKATGSQKVTGNLIGELMSQVLIEHLHCHTVLVTTTSDSPYLDNTMKNVHGGVIMAGEIIDQKDWLQKLWWTSKTCKVVILHLNDQHNKTESALRLLEQVELQKHPDTRVVVLGTRQDVKAVLLHHSFRNTVHALYLAVHSNAFISIHTRPRLMSRLKYQGC